MKLLPSLLTTLVLCLAPALHALDVEGETAANSRFSSGYPAGPVENTGFVEDASEFVAVGWNANRATQSFTLITPQHIIGAAHFAPSEGATIEFYTLQDTVISRTVTARATVQNNGNATDVFVAELNSPIPSSAVPHALLPETPVLVGDDLVVYGFTALAGSNRIASLGAVASFSGALGGGSAVSNGPAFEFTRSTTLTAQGEAMLEVGDSGSPSFVMENGILKIAGIHSALASATGFDVAIDSDLSRLIPEINQAIADVGATGFTVSQTMVTPAVPEPAAFAWLTALAAFWAVYRFRRDP
ncbi:MAG: trypsin-like serine protease [Opitutales bacterium]